MMCCSWKIPRPSSGAAWRKSSTGHHLPNTTLHFENRRWALPTLQVKVVPGSSRNRVVGMLGDALKVQVAAAAEKGKANEAVREVLAEFFGVKLGQVELISGQTQPRK